MANTTSVTSLNLTPDDYSFICSIYFVGGNILFFLLHFHFSACHDCVPLWYFVCVDISCRAWTSRLIIHPLHAVLTSDPHHHHHHNNQQPQYQTPQYNNSQPNLLNASQQGLNFNQPIYNNASGGFNSSQQQQHVSDPYNNHTENNAFNNPFLGAAGATGGGSGPSNWCQQQSASAAATIDPHHMQVDPNDAAPGGFYQTHPQPMFNHNHQPPSQSLGSAVGAENQLHQGAGMQPRNNAFLEQQQQNKNQSPAQGADETQRRFALRSSGDNSNVNNQGQQIKMEVKTEVDGDTAALQGKTQAEIDNDLFTKMKASERKRKPPPPIVKKEEDDGELCK